MMNAIRVALGYDQINLWGGSYGSLLAQATMRDHPEGIRQGFQGVLGAAQNLARYLREINVGELFQNLWNWILGIFEGGRTDT